MGSGTKIHDYRDDKRGWGHDLGYKPLPGNRLDAYGWGDGVRKGDFMLLSHPDGDGDTRYRVETIRYAHDPGDMWFATLAFAPRELVRG